MHKVLVNQFVKLAQQKSVVRWTDHPDITIAVDWDDKHQTKQRKQNMSQLPADFSNGMRTFTVVCGQFKLRMFSVQRFHTLKAFRLKKNFEENCLTK